MCGWPKSLRMFFISCFMPRLLHSAHTCTFDLGCNSLCWVSLCHGDSALVPTNLLSFMWVTIVSMAHKWQTRCQSTLSYVYAEMKNEFLQLSHFFCFPVNVFPVNVFVLCQPAQPNQQNIMLVLYMSASHLYVEFVHVKHIKSKFLQ